jgi:hypothetical protein
VSHHGRGLLRTFAEEELSLVPSRKKEPLSSVKAEPVAAQTSALDLWARTLAALGTRLFFAWSGGTAGMWREVGTRCGTEPPTSSTTTAISGRATAELLAETRVLSTRMSCCRRQSSLMSRWRIRIRAWGSGERDLQLGRLPRRACHARVFKGGLEFPAKDRCYRVAVVGVAA